MREAEQIRLEKSTNFRGIVEVSAAIRDGLHDGGRVTDTTRPPTASFAAGR